MNESIFKIHQRLAYRLSIIPGVFGAFLGSSNTLRIMLRKRLAHLHDEAKRQILEIVNSEAPGIEVEFEITDKEHPTGGLPPKSD